MTDNENTGKVVKPILPFLADDSEFAKKQNNSMQEKADEHQNKKSATKPVEKRSSIVDRQKCKRKR